MKAGYGYVKPTHKVLLFDRGEQNSILLYFNIRIVLDIASMVR